MAQDNHPDTIKEKVAAVREVVLDHSKHEITLVLTHFDNNVEQAIQAFLDNGANDILQEWHSTAGASKPSSKKKKKKKIQDQEQPPGGSISVSTNPGTAAATGGQHQALPQRQNRSRRQEGVTSEKNLLGESDRTITAGETTNGPIALNTPLLQAGSVSELTNTSEMTSKVNRPPRSNKPDSLKSDHTDLTESKMENLELTNSQSSLSSSVSVGKTQVPFNTSGQVSHMAKQHNKVSSLHIETSKKVSDGPVTSSTAVTSKQANKRPGNLIVTNTNRKRTVSETSSASISSKKPHAGLEKSLKDLQRQTASLQRQKMIMNEEMERSMKELSRNFEAVQNELNEREASLMYKLTKVKDEGHETLAKRQQLAADLRRKLDQAPSMNELDLINLRADIKHFVSERKIDEDLGATKRYICDHEVFMEQVKSYGKVVPVKASYSTRRPSVTSSTSCVLSPDDLLSPLSPRTPMSSTSPHLPHGQNQPKLTDNNKTIKHTSVIKPAHAPVTAPVSLAGAKVISQSDSLTRYELSKPHTEVKKPVAAQGSKSDQTLRRGQGSRSQVHGQMNKDQNQANRGQGQANRGHSQSNRSPSQTSRSLDQTERGQGRNDRGQSDRVQRESNRGHGQMEKGQSHLNKDPSHDNVEFEDDVKKSRSARRRQKQREKLREQKTHEHQNPEDVKNIQPVGKMSSAGNDGKNTTVESQTKVAGGAQAARTSSFRKTTDSQKVDNAQRNQRSQSPRKRNQERGQGHNVGLVIHEGQDQGQRHQRNRRQRTRSQGERVVDQNNEQKTGDKKTFGTGDSGDTLASTEVTGNDIVNVSDNKVPNVALNDNINAVDTKVMISDVDVTVNDLTDPEVMVTDSMGSAECVITEVSNKADDKSADSLPDQNDVSIEVAEKSDSEQQAIEDSMPDEELPSSNVILSESVSNGRTISTDTLTMQKSVIVSVKETAKQLHSVSVENHKECTIQNVLNDNDDSHLDQLKDINANDHSKIDTTNGDVLPSPIKKATVSIEQFNEVTTKATISVENFSSQDALPQRKARIRRRDKENSIEDPDIDGRVANGVHPSENTDYPVMNGSSNGHN